MRLWTLHPRYLDAKGLVAAWREALLAQKVLEGGTVGYTRHPQLHRFRACRRPLEAIAAFLEGLAAEGQRRGYRFDRSKIGHPQQRQQVDETTGQLLYEWERLRKKLKERASAVYRQHQRIAMPEAHPLFRIVPGEIREWERT